ncbi:MAG: dTDP-4-dehydrorhamnose 3,5-epimerase [Gemmatimonadota bacterium]|nr:dTDP-4-dehydrorhamnose 3,5-epimerase [Gemmatimonadota bacterium]
MSITITETRIPDVVIIEPKLFSDHRGTFFEVFRSTTFGEYDLPTHFTQANHARSRKGVIRGLHFQWDPPMGKMMRVTRGAAFVVAVDIRPGSQTLGQWHGMLLNSGTYRQVWAPAGFARGFCALEEDTEVQYLCTGTYNPACEAGIRWDDPDVGIEWPLPDGGPPILSDKDKVAPSLKTWLASPEAAHFRVAGLAQTG